MAKQENYKFHLEMKSCVDRIFILDGSRRFISEMICMDDDSDNPKIFNGTIPIALKKQKLFLIMVGMEGETSYKFNDLFSVPIDAENIQKIKESGSMIQENFIVINAPKTVDYALVEVPTQIGQILSLPKIIFLVDMLTAKTNLFPEKMDSTELLSRGIDPQGRPYVKFINVDLTKTISQKISTEVIELLEKTPIIVKCYQHTWFKELVAE